MFLLTMARTIVILSPAFSFSIGVHNPGNTSTRGSIPRLAKKLTEQYGHNDQLVNTTLEMLESTNPTSSVEYTIESPPGVNQAVCQQVFQCYGLAVETSVIESKVIENGATAEV